MTSLVTGATGLIGGHLVENLVMRGEKVRAFVRPTSHAARLRELGVEIRVGNLLDSATLNSAAQGVDHVYHCAGLVSDWGSPQDFERTNVGGTRSVLAAATHANVARFIYLSTSDIYGFSGVPMDETERPSPRGFSYSDSKIRAENLVWNHYRRVGLPVTIFRPATVYGPRAGLLVVALLRAMRRKRLFLIDQGRHLAGLAYVGNLVDALILAADSEAAIGQAYNISDGNDVNWKQYIDGLADLIQAPHVTRNYSHRVAYLMASAWETYYDLVGRIERPPITRMMIELMGTDQAFPIDKIVKQLGYRPRVSFQEGLRHTGDWLRQSGAIEM